MKFKVFYLTTTPGHHDYPEEHNATLEADNEEEANKIVKERLKEIEEKDNVGTVLISLKVVDEK